MRKFSVVIILNVLYFQEYKNWLGKDGDYLQLAITFLEHTSALCELFRSERSIHSLTDPRLKNAQSCLAWFKQWNDTVTADSMLTKKEKRRALISWEAREDLESAVIGFEKLLTYRLKSYPNSYIIPALVNTDCVENVFCQVRCIHNGATTNPTYYQYMYTINTIMLSYGLFKENSNAGNNRIAALPFNFSTPKALNPRPK